MIPTLLNKVGTRGANVPSKLLLGCLNDYSRELGKTQK